MSYARGEEWIARHYDGDYAAFRRVDDVRFYVEEARQRGGPVAEFACGTGRVLCPTRRAGVGITGIDVSPAMLAQARANLAAEGLDAELVLGDMRAVELGARFRVATLPFRPFQHMLEVDDQLAALANIRRHLEPGGTLLLDVFQPNFGRIGSAEAIETLDLERTDGDGRTVRRYSRSESRPWRQVVDVTLRWEIDGEEGGPSATFGMRWFTQAEMEHLLARSGYAVEAVYGSFSREPVGPGSKELVFAARATAAPGRS